MQRQLGLTVIAVVVLAGCDSPDRQGPSTERADQPDTGHVVAMDTAGEHADHATGADPHAGHSAATPAGQDPHAGHGTPAGGTGAAHEGHAPGAAPSGEDPQLSAPHTAHAPVDRAQPADPHAGHAATPEIAGHAAHTPPETRAAADPHGRHAAHEAFQEDPQSAAHIPMDPASTAATRLALLVEALLEDSAVVQRIQQDPELSEMWVDPAMRSALRAAPETSDPMAKLLELVRALTADPLVQRRIQEDPVLRRLQSRPSVQQRIQPTGRHP